MDEIVQRAMKKWPNVPSVYGWLRLDRRGNWSIKGERLTNPAIVAFIARNYARDSRGRWFFQNGPQRVFVSLAYTPIIYRVTNGQLTGHTGAKAVGVRTAWLDETGALILDTELGAGAVHDKDLTELLSRLVSATGSPLDDAQLERVLEKGLKAEDIYVDLGGSRTRVGRIQSAEVAARFDFDPDPRPAPGEPEC